MNSYSFEKIYDNWSKGIDPSHFLMGKIELERTGEFEVTILKHEKYNWLDKVGDAINIPHLDQQVRALWVMKKYDILYLPYPLSNSRLIATLKLLRLISIPIVVLVHQNILNNLEIRSIKNYLIRKSNLTYDAYAFFSKNLMLKIKEGLPNESKFAYKNFFHVNWGPDSQYYKFKVGNITGEDKFAVCAGTIDRDFDLLIEAFRGLDFKLKIFCTPSTVPRTTNIPDNVSIDTSWVTYPKLLAEYVQSSFLIIPIKSDVKDNGNTYGLTVLLDAIALGKPVVMTYHKYIDIDIEQENMGKWVKDNGVLDWRENLKEFIDNEQEWGAMGINAKNLYLKKYNSDGFASEMGKIFKQVLT